MQQKTKRPVGAPKKPDHLKTIRVELWLKAETLDLLGGKEKLKQDLLIACNNKAQKLKSHE